jgi:hypothetical protein
MTDSERSRHRGFLKDSLRLQIDFAQTDQNRGVQPPPLQKPLRKDQRPIPLPGQDSFDALRGTDLVDAIGQRRSHRRFNDQPLSLAELSWLLWATQGITEILAPGCALRTVPSAGCRHAFETYLLASEVETLEVGVQRFVATAPVTLAWTVIPYRMEWRYDIAAHRVIAMDVGHLCQNLYLACAAIGSGTCAIAAYHQEQMDALLRVDGQDEFTIYLAPVGKIPA